MAVPRSKHTKSRRNKRRIQSHLNSPSFALCSKCGSKTIPHTVCLNCGYYKGKEVINVLEKLTKKERKIREKEMAKKEKEEKKDKPLTMENLSKNN
ncbi:MAG TPA: 50S ribosomal protein L32 [Candidatus Pacearchaeota archaeon]|nr:50S ribosomal protein L32 [Candidatus Pacearchaeota archaeon]HOL90612.1 50S ribosomal protein L32 [Candidatus Pacearchaeota archaeon]HPO68619.1 50S ribosomal protein L32 [Candidatus Pacearchaeota archaeon]